MKSALLSQIRDTGCIRVQTIFFADEGESHSELVCQLPLSESESVRSVISGVSLLFAESYSHSLLMYPVTNRTVVANFDDLVAE